MRVFTISYVSFHDLVLRLLFIVSVFLLPACGGGSSGSSSQATASDQFVITSDLAEVQARFDRFLYVDVEINGTPASFVLDTGADVFLVSQQFAARLNLPVVGSTEISTVVGTSQAELRRIDQFRFSIVQAVGLEAAVVDIDVADGVIGRPFFQNALVVMDYGNAKITIADPSRFRLSDIGDTSNASRIAVQDFVIQGLTINGQDVGGMRIDTGSAGGLHVSRSSVESILDSVSQTAETVFTASNGSLPGTAFIAGQVEFGGFSLRDQFVVMQEPNLDAGLIGNLTLQQFTLFLDLGRSESIFRQDRVLRYELVDDQASREMRFVGGDIYSFLEPVL